MSNLKQKLSNRIQQRILRQQSLLTVTVSWEMPVVSSFHRPLMMKALRKAWLGWGKAQVSVVFVSNDDMRQLNHQWRGKDYATNILSFPSELPDDIPLAFHSLGDLMIAPDVVLQEAIEQKKLPSHHLAHLMVHGMLHLQGYDHEEEHQAEQMEALEVSLLAQLSLKNPYVEV